MAGVSGKAWAWLRAFLSERTFCITQGTYKSKTGSATAGVPQGAVLSPLLFIIYINDIVTNCPYHINQSLFADDIAAWPLVAYRVRSQYKELRLFLEYIKKWSHKWLLEFSASKSALVVFSHSQYSPTLPTPPFTLNRKPLPVEPKYKYLGHTLDDNGGYQSHYHSVLVKAKLTAYHIGRVTSRTSLPSPSVICRIVKAVLVPQLSYGFALLPLSVDYCKKLTQVIASPLRRCLGLGWGASAARVLWEFGLYDVRTLHLKCLLEFAIRSQRCLEAEVPLAGTLAADMRDYVPQRSARYCVPFPQVVREGLTVLGLDALPADRASLKLALDSYSLARWTASAKPHHVALKPTLPPPLYLKTDPKPVVCIRARVRLGVQLSFDRLQLLRHRDDRSCDFCGADGTIEHLLMVCPRFRLERSVCSDALADLSPPATLSLDLLKGLGPPDSSVKQQKLCLNITADLLAAVSRARFL
jgi:hypothetical protein